jgi:glycerol uptake facilitator-like aquaporin
VTAIFALRKDLTWSLAVAYVLAQVLGGIAGTFAAHLMFDLPVLQLATHVRTGTAQWFSEAVAALGLVTVILGGLRARPEVVPALVGLYITAAYWFTASTSFANPTVTIARALTDTFSGIRMMDVPAFVVAQFAGALIALGLCRWLLPLEEPT